MAGNLSELSVGVLEKLHLAETAMCPFVLQVLNHKRVNNAESATPARYRLIVSDSAHLHSYTMLSIEDSRLVESDELTDLSIIQVNRHTIQKIGSKGSDRQVVVLNDIQVLHKGETVGKKIGDPKPWSIDDYSLYKENVNVNSSAAQTSRNQFQRQDNDQTMNSSANLSDHLTMPIDNLSPYQNKWVIKARVTSKSSIRTYTNAKGEGKLFSFDLADETGEIRATAFNQQVDKFYDTLEVDKVYYISKCQMKAANKRFSNLRNDYEMTLGNESVIQECTDITRIPEIKYNFVKVSDIGAMEADSIIDVIAVCKEASDLSHFTSKAGRELTKREVVLVDETNVSITLTLWGEQAKNFNGYEQPVVLLKAAKIGEFGGGKTLGTVSGTTVKINPDHPNGHRLRGWFDNGGIAGDLVSLSARTQGGYTTEWVNFHEAKLKNLGTGDKGDYFQLAGFIHLIKADKPYYKACAAADCNKKVVDQENGTYRCDKCNVESSKFKYRLLISMLVGDWTTNRWVTMFSEQAEAMLGKTADEIGNFLEHEKEAAEAIFEELRFQQKLFKLRTKVETYQDVPQNKITVTGVSNIVYKDYNKHLMANIQRLTGIHANI